MSSKEISSSSSEVTALPTVMAHRFESKRQFLQIKLMEIGRNQNTLVDALSNRQLVIEEPCRSRLCGAPPSAHVMTRAA
jgi:hypothetical protein